MGRLRPDGELASVEFKNEAAPWSLRKGISRSSGVATTLEGGISKGGVDDTVAAVVFANYMAVLLSLECAEKASPGRFLPSQAFLPRAPHMLIILRERGKGIGLRDTRDRVNSILDKYL